MQLLKTLHSSSEKLDFWSSDSSAEEMQYSDRLISINYYNFTFVFIHIKNLITKINYF